MSRYCLDTTAYTHFKRGDVEVVDLIETAEWLGMPSLVIGEFSVGFSLGSRPQQNQLELDEFLANPVVTELVIDREVARIYAEIVVALRRAGTPLPTNDIWVAATAARAGATVFTYDSQFGSIQRVGSLIVQ